MPGHELTLEDIKNLTLDWTTYAIKDIVDVFGRLSSVSGLYVSQRRSLEPRFDERLTHSVVRLDVDGPFPLMAASGTYAGSSLVAVYGGVEPAHWIAHPLESKGNGVWEGEIIRTWPIYAPILTHRKVRLKVNGGPVSYLGPRLTVTFFDGPRDVTHELHFESPWFHAAEFEYDVVEGASQSTQYQTHAHPNRPPTLANEQLTITKVYDRAGIEIQLSPKRDIVPLALSGEDSQWTNQELHDAMRGYWSRYKPRAQWAAWMLFAGRHECRSLGGIMFDYNNGPHQRQGAAVFCDQLADSVPPGEANPTEWFSRERFFAAVHELGHTFNLSHSFQKVDQELWRPRPAGDDARSFMNYPRRVQDELHQNFWGDFFFRFEDHELYFMRHAPEEFVEMGANDAGVDHGFADGSPDTSGGLALEVGVTRMARVFEFLEPVRLDVLLTNTSRYPRLVDPHILDGHSLQISIAARHARTRRWRPFARGCTFGVLRVLQPGESLTASLSVSAGLDGWLLAEPGAYTVSVALNVGDQRIVAAPLGLRVAGARGLDEECVAPDFFSDEVARALAFGGTHAMRTANETLREIADRLPKLGAARHALVALALPQMTNRKVLQLPEGEAPMSSVSHDQGRIEVIRANPDAARGLLETALLTEPEAAVNTLGYLTYQRTLQTYANWLETSGDRQAAEHARAIGSNVPHTTRGICRGRRTG
jgi:hypothetical protein